LSSGIVDRASPERDYRIRGGGGGDLISRRAAEGD